MSGTTFTPTGAAYTWADATWAWTDPRSGKTWAQQYPGDWLREDDAGFALGDASEYFFNLFANLDEVIGVDDALLHEVLRRSAESIDANSTYIDLFGAIVSAIENIGLTEALSNSVVRDEFRLLDLDENLALQFDVCADHYTWATATFAWNSLEARRSWEGCIFDVSANLVTPILFRELLANELEQAVADGFVIDDARNIYGYLDEGFSISESISSGGLESFIDDAFTAADAARYSMVKVLGAVLDFMDVAALVVDKNIGSSFTVTDSLRHTSIIVLPQSFSVAEARVATAVKSLSEALATDDIGSGDVTFIRDYAASFSLSDASSYLSTNGVSEEFTAADAGSHEAVFTRQYVEAFAVASAYIDLFGAILSSAESIELTDALSRTMAFNLPDEFSVSDALAYTGAFNLPDEIVVASSYADLTFWINDMFEYPTFVDTRSTVQYGEAVDTIHVSDRYWRKPNAVFGDLEIYDTPMNTAQFEALFEARHPVGFAGWQTFLAGDYEFQRAFIRAHVEPAENSTEDIAITRAILNVDVPDIQNSGRVDILAAWTEITFDDPFTVDPEIGVIQVVEEGDTPGLNVSIRNVTPTTFEVLLTDQSGVASAGTVSYTAHGY